MKKPIRALFKLLYSFPFGMKFTRRVILSDLEKTFLEFSSSGYFIETGWIRSWMEKMPQSENGEPRPWFTYSANRFLSDRLGKELIAFEYGSGNSTLYLGPKLKKLISVEHKKDWFQNIDPNPYENTRIHLCELDEVGSYQDFPKTLNEKFDLIIVDGRKRVECLRVSIDLLKDGGVIILDDSQRDRYQEGKKYMEEMGFQKIDFYGLSLGDYGLKATTIFYRKENCLNI